MGPCVILGKAKCEVSVLASLCWRMLRLERVMTLLPDDDGRRRKAALGTAAVSSQRLSMTDMRTSVGWCA